MFTRYFDIYFTTATIKDWYPLLENEMYKKYIIDSLSFLVKEESVIVYAFVIMPNHIHLIWQLRNDAELSKIQQRFFKFTAQQMKLHLLKNEIDILENFKSYRKDRKYQFWKDRPLSVELTNDKIVEQKMNYLHNNPIQKKWSLVERPEDYKYSSFDFYLNGGSKYNFLTNFYLA